MANTETNFTAGTPNTTGVSSDVALQGGGFFVVSDGNTQYLTRAGDFQTAANGNLVTSNGLSVMGYPAVDGVVNTNAPLTAVNIPMDQVQEPQATTTMSMTATLDSASTASFPAEMQVYDSLGGPQTVTVTYTPLGGNAWSYSAALPASAYSAGTAPAAITGTMQFDNDGNLTSITPTAGATETVGTAAGDVSSIDLNLSPTARQYGRRSRRPRHHLEPSRIRRHAHGQPGGHGLRLIALRNLAERLYDRRLSGLRHRLGRNHHRFVQQRQR